MKIVRYEDDSGDIRVGIQVGDGVVSTPYPDIRDAIVAGRSELDRFARRPGVRIRPSRFAAPISASATLLLAGGNYPDHLAEAGLQPKEPMFMRRP